MRITRIKIASIVLALAMMMTCGPVLAWADIINLNGGTASGGSMFDGLEEVSLYDSAGRQYVVRVGYIDKPYKDFEDYYDELAYTKGEDIKPVDVKVIESAFPECSSGDLCATLRIDAGEDYKKGNLIVGEILCPEGRVDIPINFIAKDNTGEAVQVFDGLTSGTQYRTTTFYGEYNCDLTISVGHKHEITPPPSTPSIPSTAHVAYQCHVQNIGWQPAARDGALGGTEGQSLRVEAFRVSLENAEVPGGIRVRSHVQNVGWQGWVENGADSGTSGQSLRVEALCVELTGQMAERYDVYYRTHVQNIGWTGWARNGEQCGSEGYAYRMEAVEIKLVPKGGAVPGSSANAFVRSKVSVQAHVENIGWQGWAPEGTTAGTSGQSLRVEAFRIRLDDPEVPGGIRVRSHVQNIGWQGWVDSGATSGTSGQALRVEALCVELTGEMAAHYDVYYRTHVQNIGWTGWARNGEQCGSAGYAYRMEAVEIKLVPKGEPAPGSTSGTFYQR